MFFFSIFFLFVCRSWGSECCLGGGIHRHLLILVVVVLVSADQHGYMSVVEDVVAHTAQEGAANLAHPAGSRDNQLGALVLRHLADDFTGAAADTLNFSSDLHKKINKFSFRKSLNWQMFWQKIHVWI